MADNSVPYLPIVSDANSPGTVPPTSPAPLSTGYGGAAAGVLSELGKVMAAQNRQKMNAELDRRAQLADQFEQFSKDPRYSSHPDLQTRAHQISVQIHMIPPEKKLPKELQYDDKLGAVPAFHHLLWTHAKREIKKTGEVPQPADPQPPPEISNPYGPDQGATALAPPPPMNFDQAFTAQGAGGAGSGNLGTALTPQSLIGGAGSGNLGTALTPQSLIGGGNMPGMTAAVPVPGGTGPTPGGIALGGGKVTPGPAIGGAAAAAAATTALLPPPPPSPAPAPAVPPTALPPPPALSAAQDDSGSGGGGGDLVPTMMSPPEQAAYMNSIPASAAPELAKKLGVDENGLIDLRTLKGTSSVLNQHDKLAADLAKHELKLTTDADGNLTTTPMTEAELSVTSRQKLAVQREQIATMDTRRELYRAQTELAKSKNDPNSPLYQLEKRRVDILRLMADARTKAVDIAAGNLNIRKEDFEKNTWGTVNGIPVPGALVDRMTGKTLGLTTPLSKVLMPTAQLRSKAEQGHVIISQGNELIRDIQLHSQELGAWDGRVNEAKTDMGIADPVVRSIYTRLKSYAALQPHLHSMRGTKALQDFEQAVGHLKDNPQGVIASVNVLNSMSGDFIQQANVRSAHSGDDQGDLEFIQKATQTKNPQTGRNYTEREARQYLNRKKAGQ